MGDPPKAGFAQFEQLRSQLVIEFLQAGSSEAGEGQPEPSAPNITSLAPSALGCTAYAVGDTTARAALHAKLIAADASAAGSREGSENVGALLHHKVDRSLQTERVRWPTTR